MTSNEHIREPKAPVARKAKESDAAYLDRLLSAIHGRSVKAKKRGV